MIVFFSVTIARKIRHIQQSNSNEVIDEVLVFSGTEQIVSTESNRGGNTFNGVTIIPKKSYLTELFYC